jgi:hypothetical protein
VTNQPTTTFDEAAPVVSQALNIITSRVRLVYPDAEFNEILNVGYFEKQRPNVSYLKPRPLAARY